MTKVTGAGRAGRRCAALAAALLLAVAPSCEGGRSAAAAPAPEVARDAPALPAPTGALPVGLRTTQLSDTSRRDPWNPDRHRELTVSLWYPALPSRAPHASYVTARESELILRFHRVRGVPADMLSRTRVHARLALRRSPRPRRACLWCCCHRASHCPAPR